MCNDEVGLFYLPCTPLTHLKLAMQHLPPPTHTNIHTYIHRPVYTNILRHPYEVMHTHKPVIIAAY